MLLHVRQYTRNYRRGHTDAMRVLRAPTHARGDSSGAGVIHEGSRRQAHTPIDIPLLILLACVIDVFLGTPRTMLVVRRESPGRCCARLRGGRGLVARARPDGGLPRSPARARRHRRLRETLVAIARVVPHASVTIETIARAERLAGGARDRLPGAARRSFPGLLRRCRRARAVPHDVSRRGARAILFQAARGAPAAPAARRRLRCQSERVREML